MYTIKYVKATKKPNKRRLYQDKHMSFVGLAIQEYHNISVNYYSCNVGFFVRFLTIIKRVYLMSLLLKALSAWIIQQLDSQYHVEIQVPCQSYQAHHTIAFEPQQQFFDGEQPLKHDLPWSPTDHFAMTHQHN